ncbi:MAG TPA: S41 family peptidase [Pirellulales bacterium]|nr:S41 family peptidase [Pirellulales bacterium]
MPRRNYLLVLGTAAIALLCYRAADPLALSFSEVANLVERQYVDPVDRQTLWSAAVRGMIGELGDPYSEYIDPEEASELEKILTQEFGGIGIQVGLEPQTKRPQVISPIVGSPAYKAGILAGDIIAKINGQPTRDMNYAESTARIRGNPGETVQLTIERPGNPTPIDFPPIRREIINVDSVLGDTRNADDHWNFLFLNQPKIGYVRITNFGEHTVDELRRALAELQSQGMQGLVLDLRDNPGGLLRPAATGVCGLFLPNGKPIVSTRGRNGQSQEKYVAGGGEKFLDFPLVVLINRYSASASEIVAACLQDNHRATIIGERSYGKGTVQNIISLEGQQGLLKLTTAEYRRPNEHNINRRINAKDTDEWGVTPSEGGAVNMSKDEQQNWAKWRRERDTLRPHQGKPSAESFTNDFKDWSEHDPPLRRAIENLRSQVNVPSDTGGKSQGVDSTQNLDGGK